MECNVIWEIALASKEIAPAQRIRAIDVSNARERNKLTVGTLRDIRNHV